mgnify:FL=1
MDGIMVFVVASNIIFVLWLFSVFTQKKEKNENFKHKFANYLTVMRQFGAKRYLATDNAVCYEMPFYHTFYRNAGQTSKKIGYHHYGFSITNDTFYAKNPNNFYVTYNFSVEFILIFSNEKQKKFHENIDFTYTDDHGLLGDDYWNKVLHNKERKTKFGRFYEFNNEPYYFSERDCREIIGHLSDKIYKNQSYTNTLEEVLRSY